MSEYLVEDSTMTSFGDVTRELTGLNRQLLPSEMIALLQALKTIKRRNIVLESAITNTSQLKTLVESAIGTGKNFVVVSGQTDPGSGSLFTLGYYLYFNNIVTNVAVPEFGQVYRRTSGGSTDYTNWGFGTTIPQGTSMKIFYWDF